MHKILLLFALLLALNAPIYSQSLSPKIETTLQADLLAGKATDAVVIFSEKADLSAARFIHGKNAKALFVFNALQATAARTQANALKIIRQHDGSANSLFLVNAIALKGVKSALLQALAALPEVKNIAADPWIKFQEPMVDPMPLAFERSAVEWGVERINAPQLWSEGFTGQGITVGGADTGYDWEHPAILDHYRGKDNTSNTIDHNYNWHDGVKAPSPLNGDSLNPCGFDINHPCDDWGHGTHTMGTMTGDDGQGNQIGVAPGAKWIGCRNMERGWGQPSTYIDCFQWFLAPTDLNGQNPDVQKAPHVINNSWYCAYEEGCNSMEINELMHDAVIALKASGVFVVVSNGNFGPNCNTTNNPPTYFVESFSIGSTRSDDTISSFSSRGPVTIDGSYRIKPDVSAPGQNIRSCTPNNNYASWSGTSMAGPHVVGLVALILSAVPEAAGEVELMEDAIRQTAVPHADTSDCGIPGTQSPNMAYGFGRVDALAAANLLATLVSDTHNPSTQELAASLQPNPVGDEAIFTVVHAKEQAVLQIVDAGGKVIISKNWSPNGADVLRIPVSGLEAGVYFWQIKSGEQSLSGKMIK